MTGVVVGFGMAVILVVIAILYGLSQRRAGAAEAINETQSKTVEAIDAQNTAAARVAGRLVVDSLRDGTF